MSHLHNDKCMREYHIEKEKIKKKYRDFLIKRVNAFRESSVYCYVPYSLDS